LSQEHVSHSGEFFAPFPVAPFAAWQGADFLFFKKKQLVWFVIIDLTWLCSHVSAGVGTLVNGGEAAP
jgi:hypothetical protein